MNIDFVFFYLLLLAYLVFNMLRIFKEFLKKNASLSQNISNHRWHTLILAHLLTAQWKIRLLLYAWHVFECIAFVFCPVTRFFCYFNFWTSWYRLFTRDYYTVQNFIKACPETIWPTDQKTGQPTIKISVSC